MTGAAKRMQSSDNENLVRGGLGLLGGILVCGVALVAQTAMLKAIAGPAKKTS